MDERVQKAKEYAIATQTNKHIAYKENVVANALVSIMHSQLAIAESLSKETRPEPVELPLNADRLKEITQELDIFTEGEAGWRRCEEEAMKLMEMTTKGFILVPTNKVTQKGIDKILKTMRKEWLREQRVG